MCDILFQYVANMTACLILVKYSFNIAKSDITDITETLFLHQKRYLLLILELYWADIPTILIG